MRLTILALFGVIAPLFVSAQNNNNLTLWYTHPAKEWNEALPVGNGSLGGMIFGGLEEERIQLNEKTIWAGGREDFENPKARASLKQVRKLLFESRYAEAQQLAQETLMGNKKNMSAYQTMGDLRFRFDHNFAEAQNYRRELDLNRGVASVMYSIGDVNFSRTFFVSAPDKVFVIKITADKKNALNFSMSLDRPGKKAAITASKEAISFFEHINDGKGVKLAAKVRMVANDGQVISENNSIRVSGATSCLIFLTAATDYYGSDPVSVTEEVNEVSSGKSFDTLMGSHVKDYQEYFNRVKFDLETTDAVYFPTDQRLAALRKGNIDPQLLVLYYQFGRYLLISSSRPGTLPANLQGLWADGLNPPWDADYHININIQMNYWPAEATNLSELHQPFFVFLDSLRRDGRRTAKSMYGSRGVAAHFTTDAWFFTEPYGRTQWAMWPMGFAWSVTHAWEHYLYNEDTRFLSTVAYPLLKDASMFCLDWLVRNPHTGLLVSGPSISPENTFRTKQGEIATMVMGPTMDHMIIRHVLEATKSAASVLQVDLTLQNQITSALAKLSPTKVGSDGRIMEWTEEFAEPEPGHRHISHLYGLFPGNEINMKRNPELLEAARKTIDYRLKHGGGHTGWSRAWIVNFFARLRDGEAAYDNLIDLLEKSTLPNLFDNHPPFQIDGNFGAVSGITEMLMQSHANEIEILPALPSQWKEGTVGGLRARRGFEVDISWKNGVLHRVTIRSSRGNLCRLRYKEHFIEIPTTASAVYVFDSNLQPVSE